MRVDRTQVKDYEAGAAVWHHPDGAAWKLAKRVTFPAVNGGVALHATVRMRKQLTQDAAVIQRNVALVVTGDVGMVLLVDYVGALGEASVPGSTVSYDSDLAAADCRFVATIVGANVQVDVEAQWPGLAGGDAMEVSADVWWEAGKDWPVA